MKKEFFAHVKQNEDGSWKEPHLLIDHLNDTAKRTSKAAGEFENADWGELSGLWHDLGKFHPAWQKYLCRKSGFDSEAHIEESNNRPNHSTAGAVLAIQKLQKNYKDAARILSYVIGGHHAGLPDWTPQLHSRLYDDNQNLIEDDLNKIKEIEEAKEFLDETIPISIPIIYKNSADKNSNEQLHLWIRILFSCLVDADFLDTEKYMDEKERGGYLTIDKLKQRFDTYMSEKKSNSELNKKRNGILKRCREKAELMPGFFSLTVPTGGGKTLASMAFALEHAIQYNKKRIIVAIPYTSIIEQTAKVYKYGADTDEEIEKLKAEGKFLFGEDQVLEHHSNLDPDKESSKNRLASENWDAPIIVTTNVQLFESLFKNRTSACRKIHNIANSIIILDEAQMLPQGYFRPILSALKGLVNYFGVTVVLMSATQPALKGKIGSDTNSIEGLENVTEIIDEPDSLSKDFKRVEFLLPTELNKIKSWEEVAEELNTYEQVLCVVNTRSDCRQLHKLMPERTIHLSGFMCGEERSEIISDIKTKLKNNEPIRVISTQLVEAGVDIDFPVVYRALTGLDSIAQAAGRCNRENKLKDGGKVVVFVPPKPSPSGFLRKAEDAGKAIIRNHPDEEFTPSLYSEYFKYLYSNLNSFDEVDFYNHLVRDATTFDFQFRSFAEKFNMIDSTKQYSIIVWYESLKSGKSSLKLIDQLKYAGPSKELLRKLQRYIVNVPIYIFNNIKNANYVEDINGYWVQSDPILYRPGIGLLGNESDWIIGDGVV
ncbi:MAG TPA: CRISPR-associated helicase Cas3' [Ignavibacteriaceae bacterium]|nr:CRISPR-associated helicase Cas3' [Ignavibacteriaceae bacterium]HRQ55577.1 CRISPR-associated helicase Cas3' [Ignavibacteriaceae bacterium]